MRPPSSRQNILGLGFYHGVTETQNFSGSDLICGWVADSLPLWCSQFVNREERKARKGLIRFSPAGRLAPTGSRPGRWTLPPAGTPPAGRGAGRCSRSSPAPPAGAGVRPSRLICAILPTCTPREDRWVTNRPRIGHECPNLCPSHSFIRDYVSLWFFPAIAQELR
jgi:hypothetical protein